MTPIAQIRQIRIGQPENFARNQQSAINKQPVSGKIAVTPSGLAGDSVGDPRFHGGADKAVHVYALHHYDTWRRELPTRRSSDLKICTQAALARIFALMARMSIRCASATNGRSARRVLP